MKWIDATDLTNWAPRRDCQENLPLVIRRLIRATARSISHINFPAGDNIIFTGWDGRLEVSEGTEYIPEGYSVWEIGTSRDIKRKADDDYEKRKENTFGFEPSETTFVFVTPRIWSQKDNWCKEKRSEGFWKDVKVYDARDLEEWLEQASAVGSWLARHLGKYTGKIIALEDWWIEWCSITQPPFTGELVLSGREDNANSIKTWLFSSPDQISVQSSSREEAIAFLAAVITQLPEVEREFYFSKSIVIEDQEAFRHIITSSNGLLLILFFEEVEKASLAVQKGNHVFIPLAPDSSFCFTQVKLIRPDREAFVSALEKMGLQREEAEKYSRETARCLTILRRRLSKGYSRGYSRPKWAQGASARNLIPALLAGQWDESKDGDKEILAVLADEPYDSFSSKLSSYLQIEEPPICRVGKKWRIVSTLDAWLVLGNSLIQKDFDLIKKAALQILGVVDPAMDLEPSKRWMASAYGKELPYSKVLREGIAQTLVLLSTHGDKFELPLHIPVQQWVDTIIEKLLRNADGRLWQSIADVLPLLAEASPSAFLDAVDFSLSQDDSPVMEMFVEIEGPIAPSSSHHHLLWALEALAWSPHLLPRVTMILGKLAKLDPGGRTSNRPANSLRTIFLLWKPHTYTTLLERMKVLDVLLERETGVSWNLLLDLMLRVRDICIPTNKPRWREFSGEEEVVTVALWVESIRAIIERLIRIANNDGNKWAQILENYPNLPPEERNTVLKQLLEREKDICNGRHKIWSELREIISDNYSYPAAEWILPAEELEEIEQLFDLFKPEDIIERFCWLFDDYWLKLPERKEKDYREEEHRIAQYRVEAMKVIIEKEGFKGLIRLIQKTKVPGLAGAVAALVDIDAKTEKNLLSLLNSKNPKMIDFIQSYIHNRSIKEGDRWINKLVEKANEQSWTVEKTTTLFLAFPPNKKIWDMLEQFDEKVSNSYWKHCRYRFIGLSAEEKVYGIKKLLNVKRFSTALDIAALFVEEIPEELILEILDRTATEKCDEELRLQPYDVERLFEKLDRSSIKEEEIARLEMLYLPLLAEPFGIKHGKRPPKVLYKELARNPQFFADIIKHIYRPKCEGKKEEAVNSQLKRQNAVLSWRLLESWNIVPGTKKDGQIEYIELKQWVDESRKYCGQIDRIEAGDYHIGYVLARAEVAEEMWPPEAVCKIIDGIQSKKMYQGFIHGVFNKRGVVGRSTLEGGKPEKELVKKYRQYAEKISIQYPRTAALLNQIADIYESEAKMEDLEAEWEDMEY